MNIRVVVYAHYSFDHLRSIRLDIPLLQTALRGIKTSLEHAITTATFRDEPRASGLRAKESLIRSYELIMPIHEVVKESLRDKLES